MNVKKLLEVHDSFNKFISDNLIDFIRIHNSYDQIAYKKYFLGQWDKLDILYNWKSYWEVNPEAKIIHFHGPKPNRIETSVTSINSRANKQSSRFSKMINLSFLEYTKIWQDYYKILLTEIINKHRVEVENLEDSQTYVDKLLRTTIKIKNVFNINTKDCNLLWRFNIDTPKKNDKLVDELFIIRGWVIGNKSLAEKIEFVCNGSIIGHAFVKDKRLGLSKSFPHFEKALNSGFSTILNLKEIQSEFEIVIRVILEDKNCVEMSKIVCSRSY